MGCFDDCMNDIMEPYGGNMPLFNGGTTDATVTIVKESYDDGMSITRIQTPPRTYTPKLIEAINNVLGMMGDMPLFDDKDKSCKNEGGEKDELQSEQQSEESKDDDDNGSGKQGGFGQTM